MENLEQKTVYRRKCETQNRTVKGMENMEQKIMENVGQKTV